MQAFVKSVADLLAYIDENQISCAVDYCVPNYGDGFTLDMMVENLQKQIDKMEALCIKQEQSVT